MTLRNTYTAGSYGDITPRTAAFVVKELLERGMPYFVFEKFGNTKPLPKNSTQTMKWRRYFLNGDAFTDTYNPYEYYEQTGTGKIFDVASHKLTEGVTPDPVALDSEDIEVSIEQYGMYTDITDVIADTHEDPVLQEAIDIVGESGAFLVEKIRYNKLLAGTNVYYAGGTTRATVDEPISLNIQRKVVRGLKRNLGKPITKVVKSTAAYGTEPISAAYVAVCHPDLEADIRNMAGFVPAEKYGNMSAWEGEIGKVESVRYVQSTVVASLGEVGASATTGLIGTTKNEVYPILYFAANAYALVPLKGKSSVVPMVLNPNVPRGSDPLGQRGTVGIKFWTALVILQDAWMARVECGCSDLS